LLHHPPEGLFDLSPHTDPPDLTAPPSGTSHPNTEIAKPPARFNQLTVTPYNYHSVRNKEFPLRSMKFFEGRIPIPHDGRFLSAVCTPLYFVLWMPPFRTYSCFWPVLIRFTCVLRLASDLARSRVLPFSSITCVAAVPITAALVRSLASWSALALQRAAVLFSFPTCVCVVVFPGWVLTHARPLGFCSFSPVPHNESPCSCFQSTAIHPQRPVLRLLMAFQPCIGVGYVFLLGCFCLVRVSWNLTNSLVTFHHQCPLTHSPFPGSLLMLVSRIFLCPRKVPPPPFCFIFIVPQGPRRLLSTAFPIFSEAAVVL